MLTNNIVKNIRSSLVKESFCNISFDSSKCKKNSIFFAIKGSKFDGNDYIDHAIKNGARTIISENIIQKKIKKFSILKLKIPESYYRSLQVNYIQKNQIILLQ